MPGVTFPVRISRVKKCERCTMQFKIKFKECPHCKNIPDGAALDQHIRNYHHRLYANSKLGRVFIGASLLIGALVILAVFAR